MTKTLPVLACLVAVMVFAGCVSSKDYKSRLADIDGLKAEVLTLRQSLGQKDNLNAELTNELSACHSERDETAAREQRLITEVADLKVMLASSEMELTKDLLDVRSRLAQKGLEADRLDKELVECRAEAARQAGEIARLNDERNIVLEEKKKAIEELQGTYDSLVSELNEEITEGRVAVTRLKDKLSLRMVDQILFDSGSAEVKTEGKKVLDRVAEILRKAADKQIMIEGHTDNVPIGPRLEKKFPSNWELSAMRATNVVRYLQDAGGVDPSVLGTAGFSQYRPVESNETMEGKAQNRRIQIVLVPLEIERVELQEPPAVQ